MHSATWRVSRNWNSKNQCRRRNDWKALEAALNWILTVTSESSNRWVSCTVLLGCVCSFHTGLTWNVVKILSCLIQFDRKRFIASKTSIRYWWVRNNAIRNLFDTNFDAELFNVYLEKKCWTAFNLNYIIFPRRCMSLPIRSTEAEYSLLWSGSQTIPDICIDILYFPLWKL